MSPEKNRVDERQKEFVEPTLTEEASLADVTLQTGVPELTSLDDDPPTILA